MRYATSRTCSREIDFEVDNNNIVTSCEFIGGCMGNTQGVARLVVGRSVDDVIKRRVLGLVLSVIQVALHPAIPHSWILQLIGNYM